MIQRSSDGPPRASRGRRSGPPAFRLSGEGLLLFAVAFGLRALYAWLAQGPHATPSSDAVSYDTIAASLARGDGFRLEGASGAYPTAFVPPVVPWLTSLVYRAVGHQFFAALMLQAAIGACVPLLARALASSTFGSPVARWTAWLCAVHPLLVFFSGYLLTETTFCAALLLALLATVAWIQAPRPARAFGAGCLWGLAALVRPTALPMPLVVAAWAWVPLGLSLRASGRVRQLLLLALGVVLVVGPWTIRNAIALRAFVPITTGGGRSLLDANNPMVWDDDALRGGATSVYGLEPYASRFRGRSEVEVDRLSGRLAREFLAARAGEWPRAAAAKLGRFWRVSSEAGTTGRWQRAGSPLAALLARVDPLLVWSLVVLPFALWGLARTLLDPRRLFLSLPAWTIVAFTIGSIVYWGALRMRVPIEPLVALYAGAGIEDVRRRWRLRRSGLKLVAAGGARG